jgi:hypothetical protein
MRRVPAGDPAWGGVVVLRDVRLRQVRRVLRDVGGRSDVGEHRRA